MPPPDKPSSPFGAAGLSPDEIAEIDPDYLYFLRHVRPEGRCYAVEIPSRDGASPPQVVRYENPLAAPNAEASAAGSEGGARSAPSPMGEDTSAAVEVPSGAAYPSAVTQRDAPAASLDGGEAPSGAGPGEGDDSASAPAAEPSWYDSVSAMDEDYRYFLKHTRVMNGSQLLFKMGNFSITLGDAPSVDNWEAVEEEEEEEEPISVAGDDSVRTGEEAEENDVEDDKPVVDGSNWPIINVLEVEALAQKVEEEDEGMKETNTVDNEMDESVEVKKENDNDEDWNAEIDADGSDLQLVNVNEFEVKDEMLEGEQPLYPSFMGTTWPEPLNGEASSSRRHSAMSHNGSELEGAIWPTHIIERPESNLKQKLMKVLVKPFNQEEYDKLFAMATDHTPIIKERRTRRRVMYYPWKHEMARSYFDSYPDLAEQVEGENSLPHRLSLLRGFFFWLKNVGHDDQFRPWSDDCKKYRVLYCHDK